MTPHEHIAGWVRRAGYDDTVSNAMAQGILDKHAHELAEKQRAFMDEMGDNWSGNDVADLIDPEVK